MTIRTVVRHELADHLRSLQFIVLLGLSLFLFTAASLVFVKSYSERLETYRSQMAMKGQGTSTMLTVVFREPHPLTFIAEGGDAARPVGYMIFPKGTLMDETSNLRTFKLPVVPPLDWSFIVRILFSLFVILFGFQAISGEKEKGTLRLVLSNSLGRVRLLFAKYLSILIVVAIPFAAGILVSLLVIGFLAPSVLTPANVIRSLAVFLLSFAYISLFTFLSLLFTALISRSSLVLLSLLAVWVLFVIVIPSISVVLVEKLSNTPGEYQTARMFEPTVQKEVWAKIEDIRKRVEQGEFTSEEGLKAEADRAFEEGQVKVNAFYENYERTVTQRARAAKNLSRLSPAALLQYAAEDIVQTGESGGEHFLGQVKEYSRVYDDYVLKKVGRLVQTSRWSFSTTMTFQGKPVRIRSPRPEEYRGDKSDFPQFAERRQSLGAGAKGALFDLAGLIVWNIILAGLAFSAFLRTDVR